MIETREGENGEEKRERERVKMSRERTKERKRGGKIGDRDREER